MSRDRNYQRLLNDKRWKELRIAKLKSQPLCELCQRAGHIRVAVDVHHIVPVETARDLAEMERLAYPSLDGLMSLCVPCHIKVHRELGKNTRKNVAERKQTALERWIAEHDPHASNPGGTHLTPGPE